MEAGSRTCVDQQSTCCLLARRTHRLGALQALCLPLLQVGLHDLLQAVTIAKSYGGKRLVSSADSVSSLVQTVLQPGA